MSIRPMPKLFTYSIINGESFPAATTLHPRWNDSGSLSVFGTDRFGFGALPGGSRYFEEGLFFSIGGISFFWSLSEFDTNSSWNTYFGQFSGFARAQSNKNNGFSIRLSRPLLLGEDLLSDGSIITNAYTDADGNNYNGTKIGLQVWTTENLKVTHYVDGTVIPTNLSNSAWAADTIGAYAVYGKNDGAFVPTDELTTEELMVAAYGRLYNWYAVNNVHGLIDLTDEWHVPTDAEFTQLVDYLIETYPEITIDNAGDVLKSVRQVNSPYVAEDKLTLINDPKGWNEQSISFIRTEDFGLNAEFTTPFQFPKEGRSFLKTVFDEKGQYSNARCRIQRRADNWALAPFYEYKLDFKSYKDDLEYVSIDGIENSLYSKFKANADTEYELDLPENKDFLNYSSASIVTQNLILALVGSMYKCENNASIYGGKRLNRPNGNWAIKSYSDKIGFVDTKGIPYTGMLFHNISGGNLIGFTLKYKVDCSVFMTYLIGIPSTGFFVLCKHNSNFSSFTAIHEIGKYPDTTYKTTRAVGISGRTDIFATPELTATFDLGTNEYVSLIYVSDNAVYYGVPKVAVGKDMYMKMDLLTQSLTNKKLCVVTHQWAIEQLLLKIDSTSILNYNLLHTNIIPLLSGKQAISNLGSLAFNGKLKTSLKTILKSLNQLSGIGEATPLGGIGIDISGNTFTVDYIDKFYAKDTYEGENLMSTLNAKNIKVEFDESKCYNKVKVGSKATNLVENGIHAVCCENNFSLPSSTADKELDLVSPFVQDMYSIDKIIADRQPIETNDTTKTTENDSKLIVFAGSSQGVDYAKHTIAGSGSLDNPDIEFINKDLIGSRSPNTGTAPNLVFPSITPSIFRFDDSVLFYIFPSIGTYRMTVDIEIAFVGGTSIPNGVSFIVSQMSPNYITYKNTSKDVEVITTSTFNKQLETEFDCRFEGNAMYFRFTLGDILGNAAIPTIVISKLNVSLQLIGGIVYEPYKTFSFGVPINGFLGDKNTAYNIPFTPKRILNSFKNYLAISNYKSGEDIKFISTDINSTLECQLGYESEVVKEAEGLSTDDVTAHFQPSTITFDTDVNFNNLNDIRNDKYRYYEVIEKGTSFKGWVHTAAFKIGEEQAQQWKLQAKSIEAVVHAEQCMIVMEFTSLTEISDGVLQPTTVAEWEAFFGVDTGTFSSMSTNSTLFQVILYSAVSSIVLPASLFAASYLKTFDSNCITGIGAGAFSQSHLTSFNCPKVTEVGEAIFYSAVGGMTVNFPLLTAVPWGAFRSSGAVYYNLPAVTSLNPGYNSAWFTHAETVFTINIPVYFATNNGGSPDANLQYVIDNFQLATINYI